MGVKKREKVIGENLDRAEYKSLVQFIKLLNEEPNYQPTTSEITKECKNIVTYFTFPLVTGNGKDEQMRNLVQLVQIFLFRIMDDADDSVRNVIVRAITEGLHSIISDPQSVISPAVTRILIVMDGFNDEALLVNARSLIEQEENTLGQSEFTAALTHLYYWLYDCQKSLVLGRWVLAYIKALEENKHFEVLIKVSVEWLGRLFLTLGYSTGIPIPSANVVFHIMAALRDSNDALEMISPVACSILTKLPSASHKNSREILQNTVNILTDMVNNLMRPLKGDELDAFRDKYDDMITCLRTHLVSSSTRFKNVYPWCVPEICKEEQEEPEMIKVGLYNLGNTCYMNSVIQALLATKNFSNHVMLYTLGIPYWTKIAEIFSKLMYTYNNVLNLTEYIRILKPPFFSYNSQHDSSEFLSYLLTLLDSYEQHKRDFNYDYNQVPILSDTLSANKNANPPQTLSSSSSSDDLSEVTPHRSQSPCPGSSKAGGSGLGTKRQSNDVNIIASPRKRFKEDVQRRSPTIDIMFKGASVTTVKCTVCHTTSVSRDMFWDLQLSFPETSDCGRHSVQSLLDFYCSKEKLCGENKYNCVSCGMLQDAEKRVLIDRTPLYLILVLKNFKFEPKLLLQTKLMHSTVCDMSVTLPTAGDACLKTYNLYAAIIHSGNTLDSGHYYTLAKDDDQWYNFDDEIVTAIDESEFSKLHSYRTPYILFYKRTDADLGLIPKLNLTNIPIKLREMVEAYNKNYMETVRCRSTRP